MWLQDILVFWSPRFQDNQDTQGAVETHNLLTSTGKGWNEAFLRKKSSASWNLTSHEKKGQNISTKKKVMCIIPNVDWFQGPGVSLHLHRFQVGPPWFHQGTHGNVEWGWPDLDSTRRSLLEPKQRPCHQTMLNPQFTDSLADAPKKNTWQKKTKHHQKLHQKFTRATCLVVRKLNFWTSRKKKQPSPNFSRQKNDDRNSPGFHPTHLGDEVIRWFRMATWSHKRKNRSGTVSKMSIYILILQYIFIYKICIYTYWYFFVVYFYIDMYNSNVCICIYILYVLYYLLNSWSFWWVPKEPSGSTIILVSYSTNTWAFSEGLNVEPSQGVKTQRNTADRRS